MGLTATRHLTENVENCAECRRHLSVSSRADGRHDMMIGMANPTCTTKPKEGTKSAGGADKLVIMYQRCKRGRDDDQGWIEKEQTRP